MAKSITLTQDVRIGGTVNTAGSTISVADELAADLVQRNCATYVSDPMSSGSRNTLARFATDASGNVTGLVGQGGVVLMQFIDVGGDASGTTVEV